MSASASASGWAVRLHGACDWVLWVMTINVLWYLFTLAGAIVLGAAPATVAAAELTRRKLRGESFPIFRTFASAWRREFWRTNAVFAPVSILLVILGLNAGGFAEAGLLGTLPGVATVVAFVLTFALGAVAVTMYVHYDLPLRAYLLTASRWMIRNLAHVLLLLLAATLIVVASLVVPGLIPFVSLGAWLTISTALCVAFFTANDRHVSELTDAATSAASAHIASPAVLSSAR
ncbi:DUF624 domain-containing protein [Microbacterium lacus]|uniref:YesL family protein n=1 Tax=Microbacterium lacus TaxID=415217 RepID=UPI00384D26D5